MALPLALHVQGNRVLDSNGNPVRLDGANDDTFGWNISPNNPGVASGNFEVRAFTEAKANWPGFNVLMVPFSSGPVIRGDADRPTYVPPASVTTTPGSFYMKTLDRIVKTWTDGGKYIILVHRTAEPGKNEQGYPDDPNPSVGQVQPGDARKALVALAGRYAANPGVLIAIGMEWADPWGLQGVTVKQWCDATVAAMRAAGYTNPAITTGLQWGRALDGYLTAPLADGNVVYQSHIYDLFTAVAGDARYALEPMSAKYPVMIGEMGAKPKNDGSTPLADCQKLLDFSVANNFVGVVGWTYDPAGYATDQVTMLQSEWTPTAWGTMLKGFMAKMNNNPVPPPVPGPVPPTFLPVAAVGGVNFAGKAVANAAITVTANGTIINTTPFIASASGDYFAFFPMAPGTYSLTATQTVSGLTSAPSPAVSVTVGGVPPPPPPPTPDFTTAQVAQITAIAHAEAVKVANAAKVATTITAT